MNGRRRRSEGSALVALVVSVGVLALTPAAVVATRGDDAPASVGSRPAAAPAQAPAQARSSRVAAVAPRPVGITIPSIGLSTSVIPAGVTSDGSVDVPENIAVVGWYRYGARPGDPAGSTVVVGHRDGRTSGAGALFRLGELQVGDRVSVFDSGWQRWEYRVVARQSFVKGKAPYDELFAPTGPRRLTLISCGGRFLADRGSYEDNVVVTAVPVRRTEA